MIPSKTFYLVADSAHFFFSLSVMLYFRQSWLAYGILVSAAAIKEGVVDPITESTEVAGSGLRDFIGYLAGASVGMLISMW